MMTEKTMGIALRRRNFKEAHAVMTIFTESRGLLATIGYGIGHFGSKRAGNLDLLNLCELELEQRKNVWTLRTGKSLHAFPRLKENLSKALVGLSASAFLANHLPEEVPHPPIFQLFLMFLKHLEEENRWMKTMLKIWLLMFQAKSLFLLGHFPHARSSLCHLPSHREAKTFIILFNPFSIRCSNCLKKTSLPFHSATIQDLLNMEELFFKFPKRISNIGEMETLLISLIAHSLDDTPKATYAAK